MRLQGKTALVTGGGSGIGKAVALLFCKEGAKVAITGRRKERLDEVCRSANGAGEIVAIEGDVSTEDSVKSIVSEFLARFGRIDIVFNNAGILEAGTATSTDVQSWERTMNINVKGPFLVCKHVLPSMIENGGGVIINNGSVGGLIGCQNALSYCTSKGAVLQFTRSLAMDYVKHGIRVNSVTPGFIKTSLNEDFIDDHSPEAQERLDRIAAEIIPMGKRGEPLDIAYGVLYLASDEARYLTGTNLVIDGGWSIY